MNRRILWGLGVVAGLVTMAKTGAAADRVNVEGGTIEGIAGEQAGVRTFRGIPFAAPPVGELRWKAPEPVKSWSGVRKADQFGARCMQKDVFGDLVYRDAGESEDCLYLNVWTPAKSLEERLPVLVWMYGGGFVAGSSSEPRYDGENLAKRGIVVVSMNYRLNVFGFLAHPELTKESGRDSSGNYGLLDQAAALAWTVRNVGQFGGDPTRITVAGESAGSFSVSALMASPVTRGSIQGAIGESGAYFSSAKGTLPLLTLKESEAMGREFGASLKELRAIPAETLLQKGLSAGPFRFGPNVDGFFLPQPVAEIFANGQQSQVPLLAGWNADEARAGKDVKPTAKNAEDAARQMFGREAGGYLKVFPAGTDEEAVRSANHLASDRFIGYSTWKWLEVQLATGNAAVYRYSFDQVIPGREAAGATHASELEYVFGMLDSKKAEWRGEDRFVSKLMGDYWANFVKNGDPNGAGLPEWPKYEKEHGFPVMHLEKRSHAAKDETRARYLFLDKHAEFRVK